MRREQQQLRIVYWRYRLVMRSVPWITDLLGRRMLVHVVGKERRQADQKRDDRVWESTTDHEEEHRREAGSTHAS